MRNVFSIDPVVVFASLGLASLGQARWGLVLVAAAMSFQFFRRSRTPTKSNLPPSTLTMEANPVTLSGLRVLVAEDVAINQRLLGLLLNRLGCQTQLASNGRDALEILEQFPIDVVLLDINMPEMDGVECLKRIREASKSSTRGWADPRVVMTTSTALEHYRERCLESGADEFLSKPIRLEQLRAVLSKVSLQSKRSQDASQDALLDRQTLLELETCAEPGFLASILEEACQDLPVLYRDLHARFERRDWSETLLLAHALKGSAATVGALRASRLAGLLEAAARQNAAERCQVLLEQLQPCLEQTFSELRLHLKASA